MSATEKPNSWGGISGGHDCCEDATFTSARDKGGWYLDEDYRKGAYIKFCPFCGVQLETPR